MTRKEIREQVEAWHGAAYEDAEWDDEWAKEEVTLSRIRTRAELQRAFRDGFLPKPKVLRRPSTSRSVPTPRVDLSSDLGKPIGAYAHALACVAGTDGSVQSFRASTIGNRLLTAEEAYAFVESPLLQCFPLRKIREANVSLVNHSATIERRVEERGPQPMSRRYEVRVSVEPSGVVLETEYLTLPQSQYREGVLHRMTASVIGASWFRTKNGAELLETWPGSVLQSLSDLAAELCQTYSWHPVDAAWFVLTGETPGVDPIKSEFRFSRSDYLELTTITLHIAPWVPAKYVERAYRDIQKQMAPSTPEKYHERDDRTLAVFRFVMQRAPHLLFVKGRSIFPNEYQAPEKPSWNDLLREWNLANPDSAYEGEHMGFSQAFTRWRDFLFPDFSKWAKGDTQQ